MSATCFLDDNHMQALTVSESVTEVGDFDRFPMGTSLADSEASLGLHTTLRLNSALETELTKFGKFSILL